MSEHELPGQGPPAESSGDRARREYSGLFRIAERHADTPERRARASHPAMLGPAEAVRIVAGLCAGSLTLDADEPEVDDEDVTAALTLLPKARAEMEQLEAVFLDTARRRGMTWQSIGVALGLGSAQAAKQRHDRLVRRAGP